VIPVHRFLTAASLLAALCCGTTAHAQRNKPTTEELQAKYEEELHSPFIAKGNWILDYDEAQQRAKAEGKLILAYFSRSYAY